MRALSCLIVVAAAAAPTMAASRASSEKILMASAITSCQERSQFTANLLHVVYTPANNSAQFGMAIQSSVEGYAIFDIAVTVYGYQIIRRAIDPCKIGLMGLCPMVASKSNSVQSNTAVGPEVAAQIPSIAYNFPDLDAKVRVYVNMTSGAETGQSVACLEVAVSNGQTVNLLGIQWASGAVVLTALLAAAVLSQLGHFNAGSHVAVQTLALLGYLQAQAMIGLTGGPLPPSVRAWTQNFQWSLGLMCVDAMQTALTWYQRATGGMPTQLFGPSVGGSSTINGHSDSVQVLRRSVQHSTEGGGFVVKGIQRAAYLAGIDASNAYLTVLGFFVLLPILAALLLSIVRLLLEAVLRLGLLSGRQHKRALSEPGTPSSCASRDPRVSAFRDGYVAILKGLVLRCMLAAYPALAIFSFYELTQKDSAGAMVNAVVVYLAVTGVLVISIVIVTRIAAQSIDKHNTATYSLFSYEATLNKWGCFYVPFRAAAYYYAAPLLVYTILKAAFIGFGQEAGRAQAVGLIILEGGALVASTVMRPWMDKTTNSFGIAVCAVNFINAIMLLIFSNVFGQPALATGIVGLAFWILNAATTLILLLLTLVSTTILFFRHTPDARYHQSMGDDRTSFVKSQLHLDRGTNELDALALTARSLSVVGRGSMSIYGDDASNLAGGLFISAPMMIDSNNMKMNGKNEYNDDDGASSSVYGVEGMPQNIHEFHACNRNSIRQSMRNSVRMSRSMEGMPSPYMSPRSPPAPPRPSLTSTVLPSTPLITDQQSHRSPKIHSTESPALRADTPMARTPLLDGEAVEDRTEMAEELQKKNSQPGTAL